MSSSRSNEAKVLGASVDVYSVAHGLERRQGWSVYPFVKRSMDIILSFIGIIVLCPVFLLVILLIKLEDPKGSALFYQIRIGKHERPFRMIKFRSMVSDAEARLSALLVENEIEGSKCGTIPELPVWVAFFAERASTNYRNSSMYCVGI